MGVQPGPACRLCSCVGSPGDPPQAHGASLPRPGRPRLTRASAAGHRDGRASWAWATSPRRRPCPVRSHAWPRLCCLWKTARAPHAAGGPGARAYTEGWAVQGGGAPAAGEVRAQSGPRGAPRAPVSLSVPEPSPEATPALSARVGCRRQGRGKARPGVGGWQLRASQGARRRVARKAPTPADKRTPVGRAHGTPTGLPSGLSNSEGWGCRSWGGGHRTSPAPLLQIVTQSGRASPPRGAAHGGRPPPSAGRAHSALCSPEKRAPQARPPGSRCPASRGVCPAASSPARWGPGGKEARCPGALWKPETHLPGPGVAPWRAVPPKETWGDSMCRAGQNQSEIERRDWTEADGVDGLPEATPEGRGPGEEEAQAGSRAQRRGAQGGPERGGHCSRGVEPGAPGGTDRPRETRGSQRQGRGREGTAQSVTPLPGASPPGRLRFPPTEPTRRQSQEAI